MPILKEFPELNDFQQYVRELEDERGFSKSTAQNQCLLLGEEIGELFKAVRKAEGLRVDENSRVGEVKDELADVFIFLLSIANRYEIDLKQAFLDKEAINKTRVWR